MLSRNDIKKELGRNINIYPFKPNNLKENSINLCTGKHAWILEDAQIYYDPINNIFSFDQKPKLEKYILTKGKSAIVNTSNGKFIIILPCSTTLVETDETISVGPNIGGTYHSKVGLVSKGLGHIGTMLGPNFSGNSLIAINNISKSILSLKIGESFVSIVFHYLNKPIYDVNRTVSSHADKMAELGISLTSEEREEIAADWKGNPNLVRDKMFKSNEYQDYKQTEKNNARFVISQFITKRNILLLIIILIIIAILIFGAIIFSKKNKRLSEACIEVLASGIVATLIIKIFSFFNRK